MKKGLILTLKILFSLGVILYLLLFKVDLGSLWKVLSKANPGLLFLSFSLHLFGLYLSALRWKVLIQCQEEAKTPSTNYLVGSYLVGGFFNLFLPTRFGGDIARVMDTREAASSTTRSFAIVAAERINGLAVLFLFALLASFPLLGSSPSPLALTGLLLGAGGLLCASLALSPLFPLLLRGLPLPKKLRSTAETVAGVVSSLWVFPRKMALVTLFSLLLQFNVIVHYYFIGRAVGIALPLAPYFLFMPIVLVVLVLPVSINGIGLRELSMVEILKSFPALGNPYAPALAFSFVDLLFNIILGAIGGILFVSRKR